MAPDSRRAVWLARLVLSLLVLGVAGGVAWYSPLLHAGQPVSAGRVATNQTNAGMGDERIARVPVSAGPYVVRGNTILGANGKPYLFHGVARDGLQYSCTGDGHFDEQELSYMGPGTSTASVTYWGANTVRLPVSEGFWLYGAPAQRCSARSYQSLVRQVIDSLTDLGLNVIIDLQWTDAAGQSGLGGGQWPLPDADSLTFWKQAATVYQDYANVLFEAFNEPYPLNWSCWLSGCTVSNAIALSNDCRCERVLTYAGVGMQALVDAVRGTGASNLVLVAGLNWGFDLSKIDRYPIKGSNIVYDTHPYAYLGKESSSWDAAFGTISNTYPVISTESGEYDCGSSFMDRLIAYFDAHRVSWIAWSWTVAGDVCHYPRLVQDYHGTPTASMGQSIYRHLQSYLARTK